MVKNLAILISHPIQYYAPVFKQLANNPFVNLKVFYSLGKENLTDKGFGKKIEWDIPLLDGYQYEFLENTAKDKGTHHFKGIINSDIISRIDSHQPDVILIYGWAYRSHLKSLRYYKNKIPVWFRGDSTLLDKSGFWKKGLKKIFLKWIYSHIDIAFYTGIQNRQYFKAFGIKDEQLVFAPHAIDNDRFAENRKKEAYEIRNNLNVGDEIILILFAGKFEPKKNPVLLLDAFLKSNSSGLHLLFTGNGVLENELISRVKEAGVKNISILDFQNQSLMPAVYQACDLFCLPSKGPGETWGLAVNEAMAGGKAVLISDKVGCSDDLVCALENGAVFESENEADLVEKINILCCSKLQLEKMGAQSAERIKCWSSEHQVEAFMREFAKL